MTPLESLVSTGTKLWLDSVDPDLVVENKSFGATGATSNPAIISDLIETGRFDDELTRLMNEGHSDSDVAWQITDYLVKNAQGEFHEIWQRTACNDGWVSFELDPLLEDVDQNLPHDDRVAQYIELGKQWAAGHDNRMIKVPATPAGLAALEDLAAAGITLNVTLIFTSEQYRDARNAVWRGAQKRDSLDTFKSVYSIFVSRVDVYTEQHLPDLSDAAQGEVGLVNAKRIWQENQDFWSDKGLPLDQEIIFASTGTKLPEDPKDKYVAALAGSDIQTNPPGTNAAIQEMTGKTYTRMVDVMPASDILSEIDAALDIDAMHEVLMREGLAKFAKPQHALLDLIAEKRKSLVGA